jgi:hypothetical protein
MNRRVRQFRAAAAAAEKTKTNNTSKYGGGFYALKAALQNRYKEKDDERSF